MKVALYLRVSRDDMNLENQKKILNDFIRRGEGMGHVVFYEEHMSTRKTRPAKEILMKDFRSGEIDTVIVVRIDRFARSLQELVMDIEYIINNGGRFIAINNGFDFSKKNYNASNQLMLNIFSSFAQFEREIIRERTNEGLDRATAQGKIKGRHPINCGCGNYGHNGTILPVRNEKNVFVGWKYPSGAIYYIKKTPPVESGKIQEQKANSEHTSVYFGGVSDV